MAQNAPFGPVDPLKVKAKGSETTILKKCDPLVLYVIDV